jgi:hypothetical protein
MAHRVSLLRQVANQEIPRPNDDGPDALWIGLEVAQCDLQVILKRVEAVEDAVVWTARPVDA